MMHAAPRILIVDDVIENVAVLGETLAESFEIQFATSGPEALDLVAQSVPDLVLLDVMMPGMDGYEVCEVLKRDVRTRDVPVIFVTAKSDAESESRALQAGAVDFIHKPINQDVVRARVQLQIALRSRELEMQDLHAQLERMVAERTRALGNALTLAQGATRAKSDFIANVGQELRGQMNAIIGMSELALKTELNLRQRGYLENIQGSCLRLLDIVHDVADLSPAKATDTAPESIDFEPESIVDHVAGLMAARIDAKGLELVVEIAPDVPARCVGDPRHLRKILASHLSSMVGLAEKGTIGIGVSQQSSDARGVTLRYSVHGSHVEMPARECQRLLDEAEHSEGTAAREHGGIGLSLALTRHLAQAMDGEVGIEGDSDGGLRFWFSVRLARSASGSGGADLASQFPGRRMLVALASDRARTVACNLLSQMHIEAAAVASAAAAAAEVARAEAAGTPVDLVFLEWDPALSDGGAAIAEIRNRGRDRRPRVVLLVPHDRRDAVESADAEAVDDILLKPLMPGPLSRTVARLLQAPPAPQADSPPAASAAESGADEITGASVLLVEDNAINRMVATEQLRQAGYLVDIAHNGAIAVEKVRQNSYDAVLMDLLMPVMDGLTATREIRKLPQGQDLPVIAMTASAMDQDRQRCFDAGMNDFVAKPIVADEFWPKLRLWVTRHRSVEKVRGPSALTPSDDAEGLDIPGLDVAIGLRQSLGRRPLYLSLLERFVIGQRDFPERTESALSREDWATAERLAHTLKGVSAQVGARDLRDQAERLVLAIRRREPLTVLRAGLAEASATLGALLGAISSHLPEGHAAEGPVRIDAEELRRVCRQLAEQLAENYLTAVQHFERHEPLLRAALGEDFQRLSDAIYVYDFDIALEWLKEAAALHGITL